LLAGDGTPALAEAIARESDGNPFFVHALAHQVRAGRRGGGALAEDVSFNKAFGERMASLPEEARRLLEVVAVAGRPLGEQEACRAAEAGPHQLPALTVLRSHRLVRAVAGAQETGITTYHDRVRDAVLSRLTPAVVREHHRRLAFTLEGSGRGDPEVLAVHFHGADEPERAAGYYVEAADRAAQALAFDRAARLYRLALELRPAPGEQERSLRERLGDALANAGRGAEAAPEFLAAAAGSPPPAALHLRQRAALQYLVSGHVEEGLAILGEVLAAVGLKLPPTPRRALLALLLHRARLRLRGLRFRERAADRVPLADLTRIDVCHAASIGVTAFDLILGAGFQSLELLLALRAGEPARLARALAGEALLTSTGGGRTARRTARLLALAEQVRPRVDDPRLSGTLALVRGYAAFGKGQWQDAVDGFVAAEEVFRERCTDVRWGINLAQAIGQNCLCLQGRVAEVSRRLPSALDEARGRGDLYALAYLLAMAKPFVQLAADRPHENRRDLDALRAAWRLRRYSIPHFMVDFVHVQVDLYLGDTAAAVGHLDEMWRRLSRSLHLRGQLFRILTSDLRARVALAVAATARDARPHLRAARRDIRSLRREGMPWGDALAQFLRAGVAARRRDRTGAVLLLREAVERLEAVDMHLHAAAARRRMGELLGGGEGRDLLARADAWMAAQTIANPARMTDLHAPGFAGL
jgi:tetratricopeptide (TPR) repeat protein